MTRYTRFLRFAVLAGLWGLPLTAQSREAEAPRVYSAAFDFLFGQYKGESPRTIVLFDSTSWDAGNVAYKGVIQQPHSSSVDPETIKDFEERNHVAVPVVRSAFSYRLPIVMLTIPEFLRLDTLGRKILKKNAWSSRPDSGTVMDAFAVRFPHAWGISSVSRVGFNRARTQAMVFVGNNCGYYCYHSETLVFVKNARRWVLQERIPFRSQDGSGVGETRYLGVNPQFLPRMRRVQDSTRKALADSIARDELPRRISGIATNGVTGKPFPGAQVFLISHKTVYDQKDAVPDLKERRVSDSSGWFEFRQPHVGVNAVILECPGPKSVPFRGLDMRDFYLFPAVDTVVNLVAPDLRPCWLPRRIHHIESGELESVLRGIPVAESDDAMVFASVVDALYPPDSEMRQSALVSQRTYQRCKRIARCPSIRFDALMREGVVDSSAIREFKSRSRSVRAIPLSESRQAGFTLLANGERQYLDSEGRWIDYRRSDASGPEGFWVAARANYPGTNAIFSFTAPGFNREHTQALVEVMVETPAGGETPETILLRNSGGAWRIEKRHIDREVVSGRIAAGKCEAVSPNGIPSLSQLSAISGDYIFSLISDTGDGKVFEWRARFSADTTPMPKIDLNRLTPEQRESFIQRRDHRFPLFEVIDAKTGERRKYGDAGSYVESSGRIFSSKSGIMQLDGNGYSIDIRALGKDSMFGMWSAFAFGVHVDLDGFVVPEPSGHFCARRIEPRR